MTDAPLAGAPAGAQLPAEPVFVLCNARSGSTLLRYLLDTHPDIACPAETKIVTASRSLLAVHNDFAGDPTLDLLGQKRDVAAGPSDDAVAGTRAVLTGMIGEYLTRREKSVWVDKSLDTVTAVDLLVRLFPRARFICLHRHAMDVIASLLESCRWGYAFFDIQPWVARRYNNISLAFAEYWTVRTNTMLKLQQSRTPTHIVHYERLVRDPVSTLTAVLEFLGLRSDADLVRTMTESALHAEHQRGAADWKIAFANGVEQRSVERGRGVPQQLITAPVREQMNALLRMLHYPVVDDGWNQSSDLDDRVDRALLSAASPETRFGSMVDGLLAPRLATYTGPDVSVMRLTVTYGDGQRADWLLDPGAGSITPIDRSASAPIHVTTRVEVLQTLLLGGLAFQSAQRLEMLAIEGINNDAERRTVSRFLTALFTA